jgi:hypothetical protein
VEILYELVEEQMNLRKQMIVAVLIGLFLVFVGFMAGYAHGAYVGLDLGKKTAIDPRSPSEQLEIACAGMWIGEQNKIWHERNK